MGENAFKEILLVNGYSSKSGLHDFITIWDLNKGSKISALKTPFLSQDNKSKNKDGNSYYSSFDMIGNDYFVSSWNNHALVNFYNMQNNNNLCGKFRINNQVSILKCSYDGIYIALVMKTRIQIWQINTGVMLVELNQHYQEITCIEFTTDTSYLISGAKDNLVHVWSMGKITSICKDFMDKDDPLYTWNDHSLPITNLYVGKLGTGWKSRVLTVSLDSTCKVYDLAMDGALLCSILYPQPLTKVTSDCTETQIFCGSVTGDIYRTNLVTSEYSPSIKLAPGMEQADDCQDGPGELIYKGHKSRIVGLEVLTHKSTLISASQDGEVKVWDVGSLVCLKTIDTQSTILGFILTLRPVQITGESQGSDQTPNSPAMNTDPTLTERRPVEKNNRGGGSGRKRQKYYQLDLPQESNNRDSQINHLQNSDNMAGPGRKKGSKTCVINSVYLHPTFNNFLSTPNSGSNLGENVDLDSLPGPIPQILRIKVSPNLFPSYLSTHHQGFIATADPTPTHLNSDPDNEVRTGEMLSQLRRENARLKKINAELYKFAVDKIVTPNRT